MLLELVLCEGPEVGLRILQRCSCTLQNRAWLRASVVCPKELLGLPKHLLRLFDMLHHIRVAIWSRSSIVRVKVLLESNLR